MRLKAWRVWLESDFQYCLLTASYIVATRGYNAPSLAYETYFIVVVLGAYGAFGILNGYFDIEDDERGKKEIHLFLTQAPCQYSSCAHMIGWKIVSKEDRDLNFLVVPKIDAQELRAYIWEGTCSVKGTIGGRPVEGEAYGEVLYGMAQDSVSLSGCLLLIYHILRRFLARSVSRHASLALDKIMIRATRRVRKRFSNLYTDMA